MTYEKPTQYCVPLAYRCHRRPLSVGPVKSVCVYFTHSWICIHFKIVSFLLRFVMFYSFFSDIKLKKKMYIRALCTLTDTALICCRSFAMYVWCVCVWVPFCNLHVTLGLFIIYFHFFVRIVCVCVVNEITIGDDRVSHTGHIISNEHEQEKTKQNMKQSEGVTISPWFRLKRP